MSEFFYGWRRKAGCVLLVMACVVCMGWARSIEHLDAVSITVHRVEYRVASIYGKLSFIRNTPLHDDHTEELQSVRWISETLSEGAWFFPNEAGVMTLLDNWDINFGYDLLWRWDWGGLSFGSGVNQKDQAEVYDFPYFMFAVPLTILSAYLILWPGKRKAAKPTQNSTTPTSDLQS